MSDRPSMTMTATVLSTPDPEALAGFHHRLLGWPVVTVADLASAREFARARGAVVADFQPQPGVVVCLDPDGHPFCLYLP